MAENILHFTIGPVQGFIGEARRTRDFWAGSFLLSWLSGQAISEVTSKGGQIAFPKVEGDELFEAINGKTQTTPYIGSLPNRFKARIGAEMDSKGIAESAGRVINDKWQEIADAVWTQFIEPVRSEFSKDIWDPQIKDFWDINWVSGADTDKNATWLDQRKNWRTVKPAAVEGGDLCHLMGDYQEISGFSRLHSKSKQLDFWKKLSENLPSMDLKDNEYLCAIALVKRLFPRLANIERVIGWVPGKEQGIVISSWPSVSYIAALPWLKAIDGRDESQAAQTYYESAKNELKSGFLGETDTKHFGLTKDSKFYSMDGHLLHRDGIEQWPAEYFKDGGNASRKRIGDAYNMLCKLSGGAPTEFYALLIMDGDSIGAKIASQEKQVRDGLFKFTNSVRKHFDPTNGNPSNGTLIYAGGDDVLAILPVEQAIDCALSLKAAYGDAFNNDASFTVSAGIVFAQYKIPFQSVLREAHYRLDMIAKNRNGRNSLALAVAKPGGISYEWESSWDDTKTVKLMTKIARDGFDSGAKAANYSSSFVYNLKSRYEPLFADGTDDGKTDAAFDQDMLEAVVKADFLRQPGRSKFTDEQVTQAVTDIVQLGLPSRIVQGQPSQVKDYKFDGPILARFLANEGFKTFDPKTTSDETRSDS